MGFGYFVRRLSISVVVNEPELSVGSLYEEERRLPLGLLLHFESRQASVSGLEDNSVGKFDEGLLAHSCKRSLSANVDRQNENFVQKRWMSYVRLLRHENKPHLAIATSVFFSSVQKTWSSLKPKRQKHAQLSSTELSASRLECSVLPDVDEKSFQHASKTESHHLRQTFWHIQSKCFTFLQPGPTLAQQRDLQKYFLVAKIDNQLAFAMTLSLPHHWRG